MTGTKRCSRSLPVGNCAQTFVCHFNKVKLLFIFTAYKKREFLKWFNWHIFVCFKQTFFNTKFSFFFNCFRCLMLSFSQYSCHDKEIRARKIKNYFLHLTKLLPHHFLFVVKFFKKFLISFSYLMKCKYLASMNVCTWLWDFLSYSVLLQKYYL